MSITVLQAAHRAATPWRNGAGTTREIAVSPPGAPLSAFDWRISIAEIRGTSPFSVFPGIDRVLTILTGTLDLAIEGRATATLAAGAPPCHFPGEAACTGTALTPTATDLNVMTRRAAVSAAVYRCNTATMQPAAETCILVATEPTRITLGAQSWNLAVHDALLLQNQPPAPIAMGGEILVIELQHAT